MPGTTEGMIRTYFEKYGDIRHVTLNKAKQDNRDQEDSGPQVMCKNTNNGHSSSNHRGCGFVEFVYGHSVKAVTQVKEHYLNGHKIDCRIAMTNNERKNYQKTIMKERRKVFIGKLPAGVTRDTLHNFFVQFSEIEEITLIFKPDKSFGISFILFKKPYIGDFLVNKTFTIQPGVVVECELALNPQQLHDRKLQEMDSQPVLAELNETATNGLKNFSSEIAAQAESSQKKGISACGYGLNSGENYSSTSEDWMRVGQKGLNPLRKFDPQLTQPDENEHLFSKTFPQELSLQKRESQSERQVSTRKLDTKVDFLSPPGSQHVHNGQLEGSQRRLRLLSGCSLIDEFDHSEAQAGCLHSDQSFKPIQTEKQCSKVRQLFSQMKHKRRQSYNGDHLYRLFD